MTNQPDIPPAVAAVLALAEAFTPASDVPADLANALSYCISTGWVREQKFEGTHPAYRQPTGRTEPPPKSWADAWHQLILMDQGRAALAYYRVTQIQEPTTSKTVKPVGRPSGPDRITRERVEKMKLIFADEPEMTWAEVAKRVCPNLTADAARKCWKACGEPDR